MKNTIKVNEIDVNKELEEFDKLLNSINASEKSLVKLEIELFNIVKKCANELISRNKLTLISKVMSRLDSNPLTKQAYTKKFLKAFYVLTGAFSKNDKGDYFYSQSMSTVVYLKKESIFLQRIDLEEDYIKRRLNECKTIIDIEVFSSIRELYNLKNENTIPDYANNFIKTLSNLDKNISKLKGKNKSSIIELLDFARGLDLLPKKDIGLLDSGQANFEGKSIKKVA